MNVAKDIDIDELVKLLDEGMEEGNSHIDIQVDKDKVTINNALDCTTSACCVPTLHTDID